MEQSSLFLSKDSLHKGNPFVEPQHISLYLTLRCNMNCPHCLLRLYDKDFFKNEDIELSHAKTILSYFYRKGMRSLTLGSLGEILLYPYLRELVSFARDSGFKALRTVTNGLLLNQYLDLFLENFDFINISLDGYDDETYSRHRGQGGAFNKVVDNIKKLLQARSNSASRLHISLIHVIYEENLYDLKRMIRFAENLKVDRIIFKNFHPVGNGDKECTPLYRQNEKVAEYLASIMASKDYHVQVFLPSLLEKRRSRFLCSNLFNDIIIGPNGFFAPCCQIPIDNKYGDFFTEPDAYQKNEILKFKASFLETKHSADLPPVCRQCQALNLENSIFFPDKQVWRTRSLADNYKFSFSEDKNDDMH